MPAAAALGLGSIVCDCLTALVLNLNGNAITLSNDLWKRGVRDGKTLREEITRLRREKIYTFGVVFPFSSHRHLLRGWLAAHGIDADRDVRIVVVPPPQMVANLKAGHLDGFCVGEPWNSVAVQSRAGWVVATSSELDSLHPEKVLMVRADFAAKRSEEHIALVAALLEACEFCDQPENHGQIASVLAQPEYVGVAESVLRRGITGEMDFGHAGERTLRDFCIFHQHNANEPGGDKAAWTLELIRTSGLCKEPSAINFPFARKTFRADIFAQAAALRHSTSILSESKTHSAHPRLNISMNHKSTIWNTGHWPTLLSAFLYFDFSFMVWTVLGPLSAHIKEALRLTDQQTGLMVAVPSLGGAGLRLALGLLVDRFGAKRTGLLAQCIVMGALAWGWLIGLGSFQAVILMGFMLGFAGASFAVALPQAGRWYPPHLQGAVLGLAGAGNIGVVLDSLLAPRIANAHGWQAVFGLALIPAVLVFIVYAVCSKEAPLKVKPKQLRDSLELLRDKDTHCFAFFYTITFGGFAGLAASLVLYYKSTFNLPKVEAGDWAALCTFAGVMARPLGGALADRIGGIRTLTFCYVIAGIALAAAGRATTLAAGRGFIRPRAWRAWRGERLGLSTAPATLRQGAWLDDRPRRRGRRRGGIPARHGHGLVERPDRILFHRVDRVCLPVHCRARQLDAGEKTLAHNLGRAGGRPNLIQ